MRPAWCLGARAPIILTSRADSQRARVVSCALAVLVAESQGLLAAQAGAGHGGPGAGAQCGVFDREVRAVRRIGGHAEPTLARPDRRLRTRSDNAGP